MALPKNLITNTGDLNRDVLASQGTYAAPKAPSRRRAQLLGAAALVVLSVAGLVTINNGLKRDIEKLKF